PPCALNTHKLKIKPNEIIMPAYVEDLSGSDGMQLRSKSRRPIVGFCGWADFENSRQKIFFYLKRAVLDVQNLFFGRPVVVRRRGLWFRKKVLHALESSSLVEANFIIRNSFSGHVATIKNSPEEARKEYIDNISNSDFTLAVKGYGNFSLRFYETLSLGRIPLFINTDCVLPLEDRIDYRDFVVFIDYKNLNQVDKIVADFYENMTGEKFIEMQKRAREVFEKYLRIDAFFALIPDMLNKMK
ncbi:MAG: exostosin family protein, partial [Patescibacteria group bacterium]